MINHLPFEWLTIENTSTGKLHTYMGMYVEAIIDGIRCYWQLDIGCSTTMVDDDFLIKYKVLEKNTPSTDINIYGPNKKHFKKVKIDFPTNKITVSIPYCFIDKDLTKKERLHEREILEKKLPFAGYLGVDIFEGKNFSIDFKKQIICISGKEAAFPNSSRFFKSSGLIILPVNLNSKKIFALFDTATANTAFFIENQLFESITQHSIVNILSKKIVRPDFSFNSHFLEYSINLKVGSFEIRQTTILETPDKEANNYFFKNSKSGIDAVLGNFFLRNCTISFNFQNNTFSIEKS